MKRIVLFIISVMCVVFLAGCSYLFGTSDDFVSEITIVTESADTEEIPDDWDIRMTTENISADGLKLKAELFGAKDREINTGAEFWLDVRTEDGWQEAQRITDEDICWNAIAYVVTDTQPAEWDIGWEFIYGTLEDGQYRIGKKFFDADGNIKYCYSGFEIAEQ